MGVDLFPARLFGRDVVRRAQHRSGLGHALLDVERARDAEVSHLCATVAVQQDVLRLDVAMHEAVLVGEPQRAGDLDRDLERLTDVQPALPHDELLEVLTLDVLEDDVLASVLLSPVDDRDDVRMLQLRDGAGLPLEPLDEVFVPVVLLVQDLEGDVALEE